MAFIGTDCIGPRNFGPRRNSKFKDIRLGPYVAISSEAKNPSLQTFSEIANPASEIVIRISLKDYHAFPRRQCWQRQCQALSIFDRPASSRVTALTGSPKNPTFTFARS